MTIERLASVTLPKRNLTIRNTIGGDLNLPQSEWKWEAEKANGFQAMLNSLDNGYTQEVSGPTRGDALLYICLLKPKISLISCNNLCGISEHNGVLFEIE